MHCMYTTSVWVILELFYLQRPKAPRCTIECSVVMCVRSQSVNPLPHPTPTPPKQAQLQLTTGENSVFKAVCLVSVLGSSLYFYSSALTFFNMFTFGLGNFSWKCFIHIQVGDLCRQFCVWLIYGAAEKKMSVGPLFFANWLLPGLITSLRPARGQSERLWTVCQCK